MQNPHVWRNYAKLHMHRKRQNKTHAWGKYAKPHFCGKKDSPYELSHGVLQKTR